MTRILVVDDSATLRRSVGAVLRAATPDLTLGEAGTAAEGLALLAREPWDAVLLDLSLPDRGGLETLREIRRLEPALPVVVMSLHAEEEYGPAVRAAGAAAYVTKANVAETIADVLGRALGAAPRADGPAPDARRPPAGGHEELRRLSRVLHDGLGQELVAAKLELQLAATAPEADEARRRLVAVARILDGAIVSVRALAERLAEGHT